MKKTILITGSTDGIGKEAAHKLAQDGHQIIVHGRSQQKVETTVNSMKSDTSNQDILACVADLSELSAVDSMCLDIKNMVPHLDVLINNAGVFNSPNPKNEKGIDMRFAVNYLSAYRLTNQLLPSLQQSEDGRIINLSSAAQEAVSIAALRGEKDLSASSAYAQSKLALTMWSFQLGQEQDKITVIPVNPGTLLDTNMVREAFGRTLGPAEKGANILQVLATADEYKQFDSQYFDNDLGNPLGSFGPAHPNAYNQSLIEELISATEELINAII